MSQHPPTAASGPATDPADDPAKSSALAGLVEQLRDRHRDAVECALLYGSCLRGGDPFDGLVDIYLLVSTYPRAYSNPLTAGANRLLPPNVFYAESRSGERVLRAKVAVISMRDFRRGCSGRWFQSTVWGRFAQPAHILFSRDERVEEEVRACLLECAGTLLRRSLPALPAQGTLAELWEGALALSYGTELRTEGRGRCAELATASLEFYADITRRQADSLGFPFVVQDGAAQGGATYRCEVRPTRRRLAALGWWLRRVQGKTLSVLRLLKALFTYEGGLDYIAWKLERHSGQEIRIPERVRRHPLLFMWPFFWRLYRRGVFK